MPQIAASSGRTPGDLGVGLGFRVQGLGIRGGGGRDKGSMGGRYTRFYLGTFIKLPSA